jgi:hypothetical protein
MIAAAAGDVDQARTLLGSAVARPAALGPLRLVEARRALAQGAPAARRGGNDAPRSRPARVPAA